MSGEMMEFRITTNLDALRQQAIEANFPEVKAWLEENLAPYTRMAVREEDIPAAKTYRATIRKVKDRIDQSRKEAKAAALQAYTAFESRCKELTGLCDEAANALDGQIKAFEDAEKRQKIEKLKAEYDAAASEEMRIYCPWEHIYNAKWENKGFRYEDAVEEIKAALYYTAADLESVRSMGGDDAAYLLDLYRQTHDLNACFRKATELNAMREREAQRKREAERIRQVQEEAAARAAAEQEMAQTPDVPAEAPAPAHEQEIELVTVTFKVICTKDQLSELGQFMRERGIKYGRP